jgi:hypothetical protein
MPRSTVCAGALHTILFICGTLKHTRLQGGSL